MNKSAKDWPNILYCYLLYPHSYDIMLCACCQFGGNSPIHIRFCLCLEFRQKFLYLLSVNWE